MCRGLVRSCPVGNGDVSFVKVRVCLRHKIRFVELSGGVSSGAVLSVSAL